MEPEINEGNMVSVSSLCVTLEPNGLLITTTPPPVPLLAGLYQRVL